MGEIKSTLDLVLEKTRHLSQTSEEKRAQAEKDTESRMESLMESLAQKHAISGSAVVPNLAFDEKWHQEARAMIIAFEEKLNQEKDRLAGRR